MFPRPRSIIKFPDSARNRNPEEYKGTVFYRTFVLLAPFYNSGTRCRYFSCQFLVVSASRGIHPSHHHFLWVLCKKKVPSHGSSGKLPCPTHDIAYIYIFQSMTMWIYVYIYIYVYHIHLKMIYILHISIPCTCIYIYINVYIALGSLHIISHDMGMCQNHSKTYEITIWLGELLHP